MNDGIQTATCQTNNKPFGLLNAVEGAGRQIGVIVYGKGINVRTYAEETVRDGHLVVYRDDHATIHEARMQPSPNGRRHHTANNQEES